MIARSVFTLIAAGALSFAAPANHSSADIRMYTAEVVTESATLEAMATMQNLDYRTHQGQLEVLRAAVNGLGQALADRQETPVYERAREVAGLLTQAIEIVNEHQSVVLPTTYKETVKKLSEAAERLQREVKSVQVRSGRE